MGKKQSEIKLRLIQFVEHLGLSRREFSSRIGKDPGYINAITGEIGSNVVKNIYITFPEINLHWLITGEGEMLASNIPDLAPTYSNLEEYLKQKNKELELENKALIKEVTTLRVQLDLRNQETA